MELTKSRIEAIKWIASQMEYTTPAEITGLRQALISIADGFIPALVTSKEEYNVKA